MSSIGRILKKPVIWVILCCFILLPFISLVYVKQGIEFRQTALKELAQNIQVDSCSPMVFQSSILPLDSMKGKVWIFIDKDEIQPGLLAKILKTLFAQNSGKGSLGIVLCSIDSTMVPDVPEYIYQSGFALMGKHGNFDCLKSSFTRRDTQASNHLNYNTLLMDVYGKVRNGYELAQDEDVRELIKHVTVLLPEYKREKPVLIRQQGY